MAEDLEPIDVKHLESSKQTNIRSVQFSFIYIRTDHNHRRLAVLCDDKDDEGGYSVETWRTFSLSDEVTHQGDSGCGLLDTSGGTDAVSAHFSCNGEAATGV